MFCFDFNYSSFAVPMGDSPLHNDVFAPRPILLTQKSLISIKPQQKNSVISVKKLPGGKFGCTMCSAEFSSPSEAYLHASQGKHLQATYPCPECHKATLSTKAALSMHLKTQHGYM